MTRAVGYIRVSTDEQAREGVSLAAQEARIRAYALAKELDLLDLIRDEGLSGKDLGRPGMQQLISACQAGEVQSVVVVKLDRLSRSSGISTRTPALRVSCLESRTARET